MSKQEATPLHRARIRKGLTLLRVAEMCTERGEPVSEGQLSRIDRGMAVPRPALRAVLAEVLELDTYADFEVTA
jgi:transcriptional regulator with XRE-family HTH domain